MFQNQSRIQRTSDEDSDLGLSSDLPELVHPSTSFLLAPLYDFLPIPLQSFYRTTAGM
jgi:hypothetical protein